MQPNKTSVVSTTRTISIIDPKRIHILTSKEKRLRNTIRAGAAILTLIVAISFGIWEDDRFAFLAIAMLVWPILFVFGESKFYTAVSKKHNSKYISDY